MTTGQPSAAGGGLANQVLALGADLIKVRQRLDDLAEIGAQVTALTDDIEALRDQVDSLLTEPATVRLWDWSKMTREEAITAWATLIEWVEDVLTPTYGVVGDTGGRKNKIPACWYKHPDAVAELSWLCQEWLRLYRSGNGTPGGAGEWHDRWLPGVVRRLREDSTLAECQRVMQHVEPKPSKAYDDKSALAAVIEADVTARASAEAAAG